MGHLLRFIFSLLYMLYLPWNEEVLHILAIAKKMTFCFFKYQTAIIYFVFLNTRHLLYISSVSFYALLPIKIMVGKL